MSAVRYDNEDVSASSVSNRILDIQEGDWHIVKQLISVACELVSVANNES